MINLSFPKKLRILNSINFNFVFSNAIIYRNFYITILGKKNGFQYPRIGLTIKKKYIKKAFQRNRIKRLIRENFRLNQHNLPYMDFIVIVKNEIYNLNNKLINNYLENIWLKYLT